MNSKTVLLVICFSVLLAAHQVNGQTCSANCQACKDSSTCTACKETYLLQSGVCVACPANCFECPSASRCDVCQPGYYQRYGLCESKRRVNSTAFTTIFILVLTLVFLGLGVFCNLRHREKWRTDLVPDYRGILKPAPKPLPSPSEKPATKTKDDKKKPAADAKKKSGKEEPSISARDLLPKGSAGNKRS